MVVLYTNHCPQCSALKDMLIKKNIDFEEETDVEKMVELGLHTAPMPRLGVPGKQNILTYKEALKWLNEER